MAGGENGPNAIVDGDDGQDCVDCAVVPLGHHAVAAHAAIVAGELQYDPLGQEASVVLPAGQYWPMLHCVRVDVVGHAYPALHNAAFDEPDGQK